ncbi:Zinc finger protein ZAT4 [Hirschfeldia incana]|nr:Zinc finger protein ZAT4 [Hirschfeldia incana]
MERYKCRFCLKSFINGRALGGHMRSHMLTSTLPSKRELYELTERPSQLSEETESDASSSSDEQDHVNCGEFESETESSRMMNPTRKRSKRTRKLGSFDFDFKKVRTSQPVTEPEHHSSASDTTTEEDLAFCLIMLSRDKWKQQKNKAIVVEEEEDDDETDYKSIKNRGGSGRFSCETCGKEFKSYQALGGHRASHKKNKTFTVMTSRKTEHEKTEHEKVHQCPICFRVFTSGQALGGHKRSHGSNNSIGSRRELSVNQSVLSVKEEEEEVSVKQRMIDLNLPAPNEDDETSVVFNEW